MKKRVLGFMKEIDLERLIARLAVYGITAVCLTALILLFFYDAAERALVTESEMKRMVVYVFVAMCVLGMLRNLFRACYTRNQLKKMHGETFLEDKERYCFSDVADKEIRAIHMAGCAVMAYVVHAKVIEIDWEKSEVLVMGNDCDSAKTEIMLRHAGEGAEQLVCGSGQMEHMEKEFDSAAALFKKMSSINRTMHYTEKFPTEEEIDRCVTAEKKYIQQEVTGALKAYKGAISYLASVLLKEKVLKTEEIRERIEAYVAGEAYDG